MSIEEPTELISEQVAVESVQEMETPRIAEPSRAESVANTSNQEAMVAQILKRTKNQVKALETLVKRVDSLSRTVVELERSQSKRLGAIEVGLRRTEALLKRVQSKPRIKRAPRKKTIKARKRNTRRA